MASSGPFALGSKTEIAAPVFHRTQMACRARAAISYDKPPRAAVARVRRTARDLLLLPSISAHPFRGIMAATASKPRRRSRKADDVMARLSAQLKPAPLPRTLEPMLCTLVAEPFDHPKWIFETKYDGLRVLGRFDGTDLTLLSRNKQSQNFQFPEVAEALRDTLARPAVVDGEVVCFDERGHSSFRALQQRFHLKDAAEVEERRRRYPAFLYLF